MKALHKTSVLLGSAFVLASCTIGNGRICGPQTPAAYCDREAYERLVHPKAYGEFWEKGEAPGGSDVWRVDWLACGGRANGDYSDDAPPQSSTAVILAADQKKRQELSECMLAKGYRFTGRLAPY